MISRILDSIPEQLLEHTPCEDVIAPSFRELDTLAAIDGIIKRVVTVYDNKDALVGCAVCCVEHRRHHGVNLKAYTLFGYHLHDYNRIYCIDKEAMEVLKKAAVRDAKENHCDIVIWESIPAELVPEGMLPRDSEMKIFSASDSSDGWRELYNRKSVKRFINKAKKVGDYAVEIVDGEVSDALMDELKSFHISRWTFAQSGSVFSSNPNRISEYRAETANKHYLRILIDGELLACHYGMKYGNALLWHTPVINPKYLELSPLRLLLAETARYCERNGLEMIDFGLGDEAYKYGYCNKARLTCNFYKPLTLKGYAATMIGRLPKNFVIRCAKAAKYAAVKCKSTVFKPNVVFYEHHNRALAEVDGDFKVINSWCEFYDFTTAHNFQPLKWHHDRFLHDSTTSFIALADEDAIYSYGWVSNATSFVVGENGETVDLGNNICLYDFVTPSEHRNKGYYTRLLKLANAFFGDTMIYAKKNNAPSRKAIERSGFEVIRRKRSMN